MIQERVLIYLEDWGPKVYGGRDVRPHAMPLNTSFKLSDWHVWAARERPLASSMSLVIWLDRSFVMHDIFIERIFSSVTLLLS